MLNPEESNPAVAHRLTSLDRDQGAAETTTRGYGLESSFRHADTRPKTYDLLGSQRDDVDKVLAEPQDRPAPDAAMAFNGPDVAGSHGRIQAQTADVLSSTTDHDHLSRWVKLPARVSTPKDRVYGHFGDISAGGEKIFRSPRFRPSQDAWGASCGILEPFRSLAANPPSEEVGPVRIRGPSNPTTL